VNDTNLLVNGFIQEGLSDTVDDVADDGAIEVRCGRHDEACTSSCQAVNNFQELTTRAARET
jgi:hypothetical protein